MFGPQYGALGATFTVVRGMQVASLIAIIGMASNFISEIVTADEVPPSELVGTLTVTCIATLYCVVTYILYLDYLLPFLINLGMDLALMIAVIVVAVVVGKPLSYLDCKVLATSGGDTSSFVASLSSNAGKINYWVWAGADRTTCYEMKSIWGLSIALCILFAFSAIASGCLWKKQKMEMRAHLEGKNHVEV